VTDGGLVFIAATNDSRFRAFDKDTGEEIWTARLPASGHATPMTYQGRTTGRQFVVIAAGGGNKYNTTYAAKLVAFALPRSGDTVEVTTVVAPRRVTIARAQAGYAGKEETLPAAVKVQPIPFSHRVHIGAAGVKCRDCHSGALTAEKAGMPTGKICLACHNSIGAGAPGIAKLRSVSTSGQDISWVKVYDLPDFVVFSHKTHGAAQVLCADCHGPVDQRDVLAKEMSTSMTACMNCHVQRHARVDCSACHTLGQ
jgi:hypothetical protein